MLKRGGITLFILCFLATMAFFSAFPAQSAATTEDYNPALAIDEQQNRYLMVYAGYDGAHADIYGQFVNPDGTTSGDEFVISDMRSDRADLHPSVAYDSINQSFLVVWEDWRNASSSGTDIYGQLVHADGALNGDNFMISNAEGNQEHPSVAYDSGTRRFFVVWDDWRNGLGMSEKYSQFVTADALLVGGKAVIAAEGALFGDDATMDAAASAKDIFTAEDGGIVLSSVTPDTFGLGTTLTLSGSGFGASKGQVMIGTTKAKVLSWSDTVITCSLAKGTAGTYEVKVVVKKVGESNALSATLAGPVIDTMNPSSGSPNDTVTISGQNFGTKKPKVYFVSGSTNKSAKVTAYSDTQLTIAVPKVGMGSYQVSVTNSTGVSNAVQFSIGVTLTVSVNPTDGGSVTGSGIDCPGDCSDAYNTGAGVTLTATPAEGYEFSSWTGCDSPSGNVCSMTMDTNKSVTASFTEVNPFIAFSQLGGAWIFSSGSITGVLTFMADTSNPETQGSYMLAMKYNNNSGGGMQTGDYTYNPGTGAFSVSSSSIKESNSGFTGFKNQSGNETVVGSTDTLVYMDGGDVVFTATKITGSSLVGSWLNVDTDNDNITVVTFIDGSNYAYAYSSPADDADLGKSGVEFGAYSYSGSTLRNLSVSVDTNGAAGFAELPAAGITMPLSGDTITLPARSASASPVVLQKVQ